MKFGLANPFNAASAGTACEVPMRRSFWQADASRVGTGAGLGLSIVDSIAREHGGRAVVENMNDGLIYVNDQWRIRMVSDQFCRISGYSRNELIGTDLRKLTAENEALPNAEYFFKTLQEGGVAASSEPVTT